MIIKASAQKYSDADIRLLVVFTGERQANDRFILSEGLTAVDRTLDGHLIKLLDDERFSGEAKKTVSVSSNGKIKAPRIVVAGLGDPKKLTIQDFRDTVATVGRNMRNFHAETVGFYLPNELLNVLGPEKTALGVTEGLKLGLYEYINYKRPEKYPFTLREVLMFVYPTRLNAVSAGISRGTILADAVSYARDLVNEPPSVTTPAYLAREAEKIARSSDLVTVEISDKKDIESLGMGGLLGIARGSDEEPKFIRLDYRGGSGPNIVIVGKGITFDTGGLSIKPSGSMETMKLDMAGGAAILAVFRALTVLKPKITVTGLIAATENMPSAKAIKPGDIVKAMNGKTIEILNTDAEGRVVLADALSYAGKKLKPEVIIDLATLTGACMVALGQDVAGLFSNDEALRNDIEMAAGRAGELVWPMPLTKAYREELKSTVADVKNITKSRYGGAITAALFLEEFVPEGVRWAHLDIAGPAYAEKDAPGTPVGGTGFGVLTLIEYLLSRHP